LPIGRDALRYVVLAPLLAMANTRNRFPARRRFLKQSAALSAGAVTLATPVVVLGAAKTEEAQNDETQKVSTELNRRDPRQLRRERV
jgi:hypothetical protein